MDTHNPHCRAAALLSTWDGLAVAHSLIQIGEKRHQRGLVAAVGCQREKLLQILLPSLSPIHGAEYRLDGRPLHDQPQKAVKWKPLGLTAQFLQRL